MSYDTTYLSHSKIMPNSFRRYLLPAIACVVTGCSTSTDIPPKQAGEATSSASKNEATEPKYFPIRTLDFQEAHGLVSANRNRFAQAIELAIQRSPAKREIKSLGVETVTTDDLIPVPSILYFSPLPSGLEFTSHLQTAKPLQTNALQEGIVDVYGIGTVLYWNSRFEYPNGIIADAPDEVRLLSGRLFSPDSGFVLETKMSLNATINMACSPIDRIDASSVHPSLTGKITVLSCKAPTEEITSRLWYIEDAARYINEEVWVGEYLQARIKITDVKFR